MPSRVARGRRAAVDFSLCVLGSGGFSRVFYRLFFFRTHTACCKYEAALHHLPLYWYRGAYRVPLFNYSVSLIETFVVFSDGESCARPISTNPGSMEAGECGLTRGTYFVACRLKVVAVAGLLWISW